ncbi:MAG: chemotaxis protein CheA [Methylococcales bacterium]|jgi:two-component system chemotaxis sensor kinase CheA|nr:chemotaxis protein CheA [Methylococcales bacterium]
MGFDLDDEILQDFLTEAGEILEQLGEQLVDLEQNPDDLELLNAVFRGFHTVKGGAGFLNINPLVEVCHHAEDVFNVLRQGERKVNPYLMDTFLQVLDVVNTMFDEVRAGDDPTPATPELMHALVALVKEDITEAPSFSPPSVASTPATPPTPSPPPVAVVDDALEDEFDALLDELHGEPESIPVTPPSSSDSDDISESEFDALLDELHGQGGSPTAAQEATNDVASTASDSDEISEAEFDALLDQLHGDGAPGQSEEKVVAEVAPASSNGDDITEAEFDQLLDEMHGPGGSPTDAPAAVSAPAPAPAVSAPPPPPPPPPAVKAPPSPDVEEKPEKSATKKAAKQDKSSSAPAETTVRVDTKRLDDIMNMVGELVLVRNRLDTLKASMQDERVAKAIANLDVVTADLQIAVMKTRMQPIKKVFGRFPRVVRDLARNLKKEVQLEMRGEDTDLDKNLVEALADPLVHLVRNAVDHGIETPQERSEAGKVRKGTVILSAAQEGDHILLSIEDDGKGMDANALRQSAINKGMMDEESAERMDDHECYNLIFMPGFSTKEEISDVSGRGVGMDVVKTRIIQMNGTVEIDSVLGQGSRIIIKVPLTLAIMPTLMVQLGFQIFALPLASVVEIFNLDLEKTNMVDGQLTILVRERAMPLFYLREWLTHAGIDDDEKTTGHVVVVNAGRNKIGFVVDQLIGQEEVVIKPLGAILHGLQGMAGATITGDGKISLILDVPGLMKKYARRY